MSTLLLDKINRYFQEINTDPKYSIVGNCYANSLAQVITILLYIASSTALFETTRCHMYGNWQTSSLFPKRHQSSTKNQLPISVINVIMRIFELVYNKEMSVPINSHITSDQHAYRQGQSTTTALLKCQHH